MEPPSQAATSYTLCGFMLATVYECSSTAGCLIKNLFQFPWLQAEDHLLQHADSMSYGDMRGHGLGVRPTAMCTLSKLRS